MHLQLAMLVTDWLIYLLLFLVIIVFVWFFRFPVFREPWKRVAHNRVGMIAATILSFYVIIGLLDSVHFEATYPAHESQISQTLSLLDLCLIKMISKDEKTYSAPFAIYAYERFEQTYPRLNYGGSHLHDMNERSLDIFQKISVGAVKAFIIIFITYALLFLVLSWKQCDNYWKCVQKVFQGKTFVAWREMLITYALILLILFSLLELIPWYHLMGTDKVGHDVFYASIKSIRTGLLIGTLTTLFMLPFALILGMVSGYFGGWLDDVIQYAYTTLSSIPGVLLISATILVMQVYISRHAELFPTLAQRADARLLALCIILGVTSWASLCRLLRAETLKLRELEFVQAAYALGVRHFRILFRHILPNLMHIVLITVVLDFSMLVLAEAVLSYVGVGVDPMTYSWGNMINSSRLELAREPMVWWPLASALIFMFGLVLSANLFSDTVRDALDPRIRMES